MIPVHAGEFDDSGFCRYPGCELHEAVHPARRGPKRPQLAAVPSEPGAELLELPSSSCHDDPKVLMALEPAARRPSGGRHARQLDQAQAGPLAVA